ncbi:MAG TPA: PVC-type heme-binding CxxCH protein [Chthoniobacteraceae bacterium]|jgi:putative membrane-bound dehydrogenase-like protein|nr:PVC-type heme-binding CxxCH protein [Chthoniobacteraceae bacterium]
MRLACLFALLGLVTRCLDAAPTGPALPVVPAEIPPRIELRQPGVKLTLLAEHPDLVTPTGLDVDAKGNIWLIACHTHFRPAGYQGPEYDEILVFDREGKNRRVYYNKTKATMQLKLGRDGWVYLVERNRLLRVRDSDGDGVADVEEVLATLDTLADYPHNGFCGIAWHPAGDLVFAMGQNLGKEWTLTSRDGVKETGRGEGGMFRCEADGSKLRRIARGFWNPFALHVRADGEIFAADNDPGSRPPCRLLSIVEGADYGFQRAYGEDAVHPFVAWNGELRGTLGMIYPSGEGPCAMAGLGGGVMVTSWSNHCVDYFPLTRKGAGYTALRVELVRGGEFFRPVGLAPGPDGAFYLTDWVFSSYPVHGRGRLWRLEIDQTKAGWIKPAPDSLNEPARLAKEMREGQSKLGISQLLEHARGSDPYLSDAALTALARQSSAWTPEALRAMPAQDRLWALVALRRVDLREEKWVRALLEDRDPEVRFECLRWIADAVLTSFRPEVERMLARPDLDYREFEALLATWNTLRGKPEAGVTDPETLVERVTNPDTPARLKAYALRLAPATHAKITVPLLRELFAAGDAVLCAEVVRTLAARNADDARALLAELAAGETQAAELRADAIAGLAGSTNPAHQALLVQLAAHELRAIRDEALRALRFRALDDASRTALQAIATKHPESAPLVSAALDAAAIHQGRPAFEDTAAWLKRVAAAPGEPSAEAGRRIFFHSRIGLCATCHRHNGRGNVVGPDLTFIAQQGDPASLLRSILEPNRDVAPQFYPTLLKLRNGTDFVGILLRSSNTEVYRDFTGAERSFQKSDILERIDLQTSPMPVGLAATLTDGDLRDLLAFLSSR